MKNKLSKYFLEEIVQISFGSIQLNIKFISMTQKEEPETHEKEDHSSEGVDTEFEEYHFQQYDHSDLDMEQEYLSRLKQQRRRIEQLSQLHHDNQDKLRRQMEKNRTLQDQLSRLSSVRDYQSKYTQISNDLQVTVQENRVLKDQIATIKQELLLGSNDKAQTIQKLRLDLSLQKQKENARIEQLQDEISNRQQQLQRFQRDTKNREKEYQETITSLKFKIQNLIQEHQQEKRNEQRKSQKVQRQLQSRSAYLSQIKGTQDMLQKENSQLNEEVFRLSSMLASRQLELKSQAQKFKMKLAGLKKQLKTKEKEQSDLRETLRRQQREAKDSYSELEILRVQIKRTKQTLEIERHQNSLDFTKEKQLLQATIAQHLNSIDELVNMKNQLLSENKKLMSIIKKKEVIQKQRKALLRTELKEIDKLEKVIDKIVE